MIDLHNHILPALDDGAPDLQVSQAMLARFAGLGFTRLVPTPHLRGPLGEQASIATNQALEAVRSLAGPLGIAIDLGYEHVIGADTLTRLHRGEPSTLAGSRAVLLETPSFSWPLFAEPVLFELQVAGYRPVLAHPERYPAIQDDHEIALRVAERGTVLQLTTSSFAGAMGRNAQRVAHRLLTEALDRNLLVVLSSDAHSDGQRLIKVGDGLAWIRQRFEAGDEIIRWASKDVPGALLDPGPGGFDELEQLRRVPVGWAEERGRRRWSLFNGGRASTRSS